MLIAAQPPLGLANHTYRQPSPSPHVVATIGLEPFEDFDARHCSVLFCIVISQRLFG